MESSISKVKVSNGKLRKDIGCKIVAENKTYSPRM